MRLARPPTAQARPTKVSAALHSDELRVRLSRAIDAHDNHRALQHELGLAMRPDLAIEHGRLADEAAQDAADVADQITALGSDRPGAIARRHRTGASNWISEPAR